MIKKLIGIALYIPTYYAVGAIKWVVDSPDPENTQFWLIGEGLEAIKQLCTEEPQGTS